MYYTDGMNDSETLKHADMRAHTHKLCNKTLLRLDPQCFLILTVFTAHLKLFPHGIPSCMLKPSVDAQRLHVHVRRTNCQSE